MTPQQFDQLPESVKNILATFNDDKDPYQECKRIEKLLADDYIIDYGLDGVITDIEPIFTVTFRKYLNGDIIALFPYEIETYDYFCLSYMHYGQHSAADYQLVVSDTVPANSEEYRDLKNELENHVGYKLKVKQRINYRKFQKSIKTFRKNLHN